MFFARRRVELLSIALTVLLAAGISLPFLNRHLDRSFITYRIVEDFRTGAGLAYNPGPARMLPDASSPLYAALLSTLANLPYPLPLISNIVGTVTIALGGLALYSLALHADRWMALASALLYVLFPLLWITLGLDVSLWIALCLIGLWLYLREWGILAAVLLSFATLMHPETLALLLIILADFIVTGKPFKVVSTVLFAAIVLLGIFWMISTFGAVGPVPGSQPHPTLTGSSLSDIAGSNAFTGLAAVAAAMFATSPFWLILPLVMIPGLFRLREQRWALLLSGWALLHLIVLIVLGVSIFAWDLAPLIPSITGLVGLGITWLIDHVKVPGASWALGALGAVILLSAAAQSLITIALEPQHAPPIRDALHPTRIEPGYEQAGQWLQANTDTAASIGTTQPGLLGYEAGQRPILDTQGILNPPQIALAPGDGFSWLAYHSPDVLVLRESEAESLGEYNLKADSWFAAMYKEEARFPVSESGEDLLIFQRVGETHPVGDALMSMVQISPDLTLNRIGADFSLEPLEGGRMGLVSLQWLVGPQMKGSRYVAVRIQGRDGSVAALSGRTLNFTGWPTRSLVTSYQTIEVAGGLAPGVYDISVGLGTDAFNVTWYPIALAKVPFENSVLVGGVSGTNVQFGAVNLIGYRISRTPEGLEVLLLWEAQKQPVTDYQVLIQVRDSAGGIAAQLQTQPFNGSYPTSTWSAGEKIPDTYHVDISVLPPGDYEVFASLLAPDGNRLRSTEGQDAISVGRLSITP